GVQGPSLTGRVLARTPGVRLYCRYRSWARGPWRYAGNDLDAFAVTAGEGPVGEVLRVSVIIGTGPEPFDRLLRPLGALLAPGGPLERESGRRVELFWQTGGQSAPGVPATPLVSPAELDERLRGSDVVSTHAGVGCTL